MLLNRLWNTLLFQPIQPHWAPSPPEKLGDSRKIDRTQLSGDRKTRSFCSSEQKAGKCVCLSFTNKIGTIGCTT
ncbi:hypothetical protein [Microcoleus sp. herbarium14]|uniref:hypothetical protein n=1 Tax=Microcoleus sp. herbarium14 TaxID=3055439 RepID=UPI002FD2DE6D